MKTKKIKINRLDGLSLVLKYSNSQKEILKNEEKKKKKKRRFQMLSVRYRTKIV